jgi:hypothetical protein
MAQDGGCLCGAVRFRAQGEPINVRICHCRLCQKALSAPFYARALFPFGAVEVDGPLERFPSSDHIWRAFCRDCGSRLFSERVDGSGIGVALAAFDDQSAFWPTEHIFVASKAPWLKLDDGLPQHQERPPE